MSLVIYTAIFGDYDILSSPKIVNKKIKYVCFTDKKIECYPWEIRIVKPKYYDYRRENRRYKILSHKFFKEYDYSVYLDGNYTIMCDLEVYIKDWLGENDIAVQKHPRRNCIYKEAKHIIKKKLDSKLVIEKQIKKYKNEGYPKNNGLAHNCFIIRRHTNKIKEFNEMWWKEVKNNSFRDQISFKFVLHKLKMNCSIIPLEKSQMNNIIKRNIHKIKQKLLYNEYYLDLILDNFVYTHPRFNKIIYPFKSIKIINFFYNKFVKYLQKRVKIPNFIYYFFQFIYSNNS